MKMGFRDSLVTFLASGLGEMGYRKISFLGFSFHVFPRTLDFDKQISRCHFPVLVWRMSENGKCCIEGKGMMLIQGCFRFLIFMGFDPS